MNRKGSSATSRGGITVRTQLSLIPDLVPEKVLRVRTAAPAPLMPAAVQAVLVALAPRLPAQSLPTVHADCVEIPVLKSTELEGTLRDAGFTWHTTPRGFAEDEGDDDQIPF